MDMKKCECDRSTDIRLNTVNKVSFRLEHPHIFVFIPIHDQDLHIITSGVVVVERSKCGDDFLC